MSQHLTLISADCHAGANHETYRSYLEAKYLDQFDAWRGRYKNPFRDLQDDGRSRNWDSARRMKDLEDDGQVGEVVFPNTVPPFFPTAQHIAPQPTAADYELRRAGIRAHNRWLSDWCAEEPDRRAGIGQVFLNNVDDAVEDATWIAAHGLRGGVLIPGAPPDRPDIEPLYSNYYDPLWRTCEDLGLVVNHHSGGGAPNYGKHAASMLMWMAETPFYSRRAVTALVLSGVFERFPTLKFVLTEIGASWLPPLIEQWDQFHAQMQHGRIGEMGMPVEARLKEKPSFYVDRNVWLGMSFPSPSEAETWKKIGAHKLMWGSDYPHNEACWPYTREHLRRSFHDTPERELRMMLSENIAGVYGFDLVKLAPLADQVGPTLDEVRVPLDAIPEGATSPAFYRN